jgi:hypothetical protein
MRQCNFETRTHFFDTHFAALHSLSLCCRNPKTPDVGSYTPDFLEFYLNKLSKSALSLPPLHAGGLFSSSHVACVAPLLSSPQ